MVLLDFKKSANYPYSFKINIMIEYPPGYLEYLYEQIASISSILGGFSIAALTVLLTAKPKQRIASWATGSAGLAAGILISTSFLASILASDALKTNATNFSELTASIQPLVGIVGPLFPVGIYTLLISLGLSGWVRSKATGITTSVAALIGLICVTYGFFATV